MHLTWQIVRKDLIRFRFVFLGWLLLLAGKFLFFSIISGVFGHPSVYWLSQYYPMTSFFVASIGVPALFAYFLLAALVSEDSPNGRDPFWVTRPISGTQLLAAKSLLALLMFVLVPLLAALPWWLACGLDSAALGSLIATTAAAYLLLVLSGLALASLTKGYPRYIVWTLAAIAIVAIANSAPLIFGAPGKMPTAFYVWMLAACFAALAIEIIWHRFVVRHFRFDLLIVGGLTLGVSVWLVSSPPASLQRWFLPPAAVVPTPENIRVTITGDVRAFLNGGLTLPLRIDGLPENSVPLIWMDARWKSRDGKVWPTRGKPVGNLQPMRRVARQILHLPADPSAPIVDHVSFILASKYADRIAAEAATVEGKARVNFFELKPVAEVAVGNTIQHFPGGSFTVSDYLERDREISFLITARVPATTDREYRGVTYVALVNHRTGEIIEPFFADYRTGGQPMVNDVAVLAVGMQFKIADPAWLREAKLVFLGMGPRHEIICDVPAFTRPANRAAPLQPTGVSVPAETLSQYFGTYQPRPGATLTIRQMHGVLILKEGSSPQVPLTPNSETRFHVAYASWIFASDGYDLEFVKNAEGRFTHFVVHQGGHDFPVPRIEPAVKIAPTPVEPSR